VEVQQRLSSPALEAAQELGQKLFNLTSGTAPKLLRRWAMDCVSANAHGPE
jgi:hypothetical protein